MLDIDLNGCGCKGTVGLGCGSDGLDSEVDVFRYLYRSTSDRRLCYCVVWIYRYYWPIGDNSRYHTCGEMMWHNRESSLARTGKSKGPWCGSRAHVPVGQTGTGRSGRLRLSRMLPFRTKRLIMASAIALSLVAPLTRISQYYW